MCIHNMLIFCSLHIIKRNGKKLYIELSVCLQKQQQNLEASGTNINSRIRSDLPFVAAKPRIPRNCSRSCILKL